MIETLNHIPSNFEKSQYFEADHYFQNYVIPHSLKISIYLVYRHEIDHELEFFVNFFLRPTTKHEASTTIYLVFGRKKNFPF